MRTQPERLLEVSDLCLSLKSRESYVPILSDVAFAIKPGEAVGLVGESGSGKSMTARSIAQLLPPGARVDGEISFDGTCVTDLTEDSLRDWRRHSVQMIFQDPRAHLNPVRKVGDFLREALVVNEGVAEDAADRRNLELLERLRVSHGRVRMDQYPHELSGGLLQRVMIAACLAVSPKLLIADEPTTALDVTSQAEVVGMLDELRRERGMALLFITHDLELAAAICDRTLVMYAGTIVEDQASAGLNERPLHPYTSALLAARPDVSERKPRLETIPGRPISAAEAPAGCPFSSRCGLHDAECDAERPPLRAFEQGKVACVHAERLRELTRSSEGYHE